MLKRFGRYGILSLLLVLLLPLVSAFDATKPFYTLEQTVVSEKDKPLKAVSDALGNFNVFGVLQPNGNLVLGAGSSGVDRTSLGTWAYQGIHFYSTCKQKKNGGPCPDGTYDDPIDGGVIIKPRTGDLFAKGKIGVGTADPQAKLQVVSDILVSNQKSSLRITATDTQDETVIRYNSGGGAGGLAIQNGFGTGVMKLTGNGNVGIGTINPQTKLDVTGSMRVTGGIGVGGMPRAKLDVQGGAALLGDAYTINYLDGKPESQGAGYNSKMPSGFYQSTENPNANPPLPEAPGDVPDKSHPWTYVINTAHSNPNNLFQMQIGSTFSQNDRLFFRKIGVSDLTSAVNSPWYEVATRGVNTFTGNQIVQGTITAKSTGTNTPALFLTGTDTNNIFRLIPRVGAGGYNPISRAGDIGLFFSAGNINTGSLVIAPHSSAASSGLRITKEGNVGIGIAEPGTYKLNVNGVATSTGGWQTSSDARLKENVRQLEDVLDKLERIRGVSFERKSDGNKEIGVIAQEVEKEFPELVTESADGYKAVDYGRLTAVLIEAVRELQAENEALKARLDALEAG